MAGKNSKKVSSSLDQELPLEDSNRALTPQKEPKRKNYTNKFIKAIMPVLLVTSMSVGAHAQQKRNSVKRGKVPNPTSTTKGK
jgi:hypothetical protein